MAYRRKKKRGMWVPLAGENRIDTTAGPASYKSWGYRLNISVPGDDTGILQMYPLTAHVEGDYAGGGLDISDDVTQTLQLARGLFCKRLLGNIFLGRSQRSNNQEPTNAVVGAGIFVAPADSSNQGHPYNMPSTAVQTGSSAAADSAWAEFSPLANTTQNQPWMWRRTWVLQNIGASGSTDSESSFPENNTTYAGMRNGPNIDVKSRRFIPVGSQLWLALATLPLYPVGGGGGEDQGEVWGIIDLRMYGNLTGPSRRGGSFGI